MQIGNHKLSIVASNPPWLTLTDTNTYLQYSATEITRPQHHIHTYNALLTHTHPSLIPVIHHSNTHKGTLVVLTTYFESTVKDMLPRSGTFKNDQLTNTLEDVILLLQKLHQSKLDYGMMSPSTICFCNGEIKLGYGPQLQRGLREESISVDLLALGNLFLELAVGPNASRASLKRLQLKYSKRLSQLIKALIHPQPQQRSKVLWMVDVRCEQSQQVEVQKSALSETSNIKEMEYSFEYFQNKIRRIDDLVEECMKKSKRLMAKSENISR